MSVISDENVITVFSSKFCSMFFFIPFAMKIINQNFSGTKNKSYFMLFPLYNLLLFNYFQ
ncbi:hypothetical protein DN342_25275 [Salmonella enterica subsp. enterica serovar Enteritidis]|nr:hypothetical protein [Salmonella enterica subsp. diarizonae]EBK3086868.1 hypothetical protein [Salmonella enterica]EBV2375082.1 hypothetical protein [Salmonella enterica subsp. enterica serovar Enteritidis]EGX1470148.1 hypothetical protein [Salmonella enterica]